MDAAEYKHIVLGLIFLNTFQTALKIYTTGSKEDKLSDAEDKDSTWQKMFLCTILQDGTIYNAKSKTSKHR